VGSFDWNRWYSRLGNCRTEVEMVGDLLFLLRVDRYDGGDISDGIVPCHDLEDRAHHQSGDAGGTTDGHSRGLCDRHRRLPDCILPYDQDTETPQEVRVCNT
jgi:hypothetical protein